MNYLVVLIVDNNDICPDVLDAWQEIGVPGITILASTGIGRVRKALLSDDIPLLPSINSLFVREEENHRTLFSVVQSQEMVDKMIAVAQEKIGSLEDPQSGFLFVTPVSQVVGWKKPGTDQSQD